MEYILGGSKEKYSFNENEKQTGWKEMTYDNARDGITRLIAIEDRSTSQRNDPPAPVEGEGMYKPLWVANDKCWVPIDRMPSKKNGKNPTKQDHLDARRQWDEDLNDESRYNA